MRKELIFIGLGRMGLGMAEHLKENDYKVHGFDVSEKARQEAENVGIETDDNLDDLMNKMPEQKIVWLMVPSKFVDQVIGEIEPKLNNGDIVIDGGNSFFKDTLRRHKELAAKGVHYIDCGTSGGVQGARYGASLMVGGSDEVIGQIEHIFHTLAAKNAYAHVGKTGAGHFVKMVHNGIEYGMMGAIAEGISYIEDHQGELDIKVKEVFKPYRHGSVIESRLVDWLAEAYLEENYLEHIAGEVPRGETEEEMEFIISEDKTSVLKAAVEQRKATRQKPSRVGTLLSAMRNKFGGHAVVKK